MTTDRSTLRKKSAVTQDAKPALALNSVGSFALSVDPCPRMTQAAKEGTAIAEGCRIEIELAQSQQREQVAVAMALEGAAKALREAYLKWQTDPSDDAAEPDLENGAEIIEALSAPAISAEARRVVEEAKGYRYIRKLLKYGNVPIPGASYQATSDFDEAIDAAIAAGKKAT